MIAEYLQAIRRVRTSGAAVDELSYYPAISAMLNGVGDRLDPKIHCVMNLRNVGAGLPDGGLFTHDQVGGSTADRRGRARASRGTPSHPPSTMPERGAIEVKSASMRLEDVVDGEQTRRYSSRYGQVLVTNLREFALIVEDSRGRRVVDQFSIAETEAAFWRLVDSGRTPRNANDLDLADFIIRVMLRKAPVREAGDIARLFAMFAREAKTRIQTANPPGLNAIRTALEASLGVTFTGSTGDQFFRSTLVQTLFYGIFSAWVLWARRSERRASDVFNWHETAWHIQVPMARALFEQVATRSLLEPLGLVPILDAVTDALNRVDRGPFFETFDQGNAVMYFYEPFLRTFDPELRKRMGVWFTPPEVVEYMVARVDRVLRERLGRPNGFLDDDVYVLDPCVGTGSFLIAVMRLIGERLGVTTDLTAAPMLKEIVRTRIFGFELLPAPYVVAHLQIGLFLNALGVPFVEGDNAERAQVYLSNSLTGWNASDDAQQRIPFPGFEEERDHANDVKRRAPILVIIGNPPYDGFSGVSPQEEDGLIEPYKERLRPWGFTKHKLDDPYIRFFRIAENRIARHEPYRGIVCYISNYSWVGHKTCVGVRQSLMENFEQFWVDDLHGNRKISEYGPDGRTSETIFAMPGFSSGIQQGVVISLWLRTGSPDAERAIRYRSDFSASRASDRKRQLVASLAEPDPDAMYETIVPTADRFFSFKPATVIPEYNDWTEITALCEVEPSLGLNENRKGALIDARRDIVETRMRAYFSDASDDDLRAIGAGGIVDDAPRFDADAVRARLLRGERFDPAKVVRFLYRPFDVRWAYITGGKLWNEARSDLQSQIGVARRFIIYRRNAQEPNDGVPLYSFCSVGDQHAFHKDAYFIPMHRFEGAHQSDGLFQGPPVSNLSRFARHYLNDLGYSTSDIEGARSEDVWYHCMAVAFSTRYMLENADALAERVPRFPLPRSRADFEASVRLGRRLGALIDLDHAVVGVTAGSVPTSLRNIAVLTRTDGSSAPLRSDDLAISVGWGRLGKNGVNPGRGKVVYHLLDDVGDQVDIEDSEHIDEPAVDIRQSSVDVFLNDEVFWRNVPGEVWDYWIAGYQVLKKWLSYRDQKVTGNPLSIESAREFSNIARRLSVIVEMGHDLNTNYDACKREIVSLPTNRTG